MNETPKGETVRETRIAQAIWGTHRDRTPTHVNRKLGNGGLAIFLLFVVGFLTNMLNKYINLNPLLCTLIAAASWIFGSYISNKLKPGIPICIIIFSTSAYMASEHESTPSIVLALLIAAPFVIGILIYNPRIANYEPKPFMSYGEEYDQQVYSLLTNTYNAWKSGAINTFSEQFQKKIETKSLEEFLKDYFHDWSDFHVVLSERFKSEIKFNSDEFIIFFHRKYSGINLLLTNQRLIYYEMYVDSEYVTKYEAMNSTGIVNFFEIGCRDFEDILKRYFGIDYQEKT